MDDGVQFIIKMVYNINTLAFCYRMAQRKLYNNKVYIFTFKMQIVFNKILHSNSYLGTVLIMCMNIQDNF